MEKCWTLEPTSDRIMADIDDLENVLQAIIDAKGCVVPECRLRHGHRQQAHNGGRVLKRKGVTQRQRIGLMKMGPIHPDAEDALKILLGQRVDAEEPENPQAEDEAMMELLVAALEEGLGELGEGENDPDGEDDEEE
jgi:hypothetical protein